MDEGRTPHPIRYLPHVFAATLLVGVCPVVTVWMLRADGMVGSVALSVALSIALALGASYLGGAFWSSRPGSGDLLFSELMLWGWIRRLWSDRKLASVLRLLGGSEANAELISARRAELLAQLALALEAGDRYTQGHSRRVARHAETIARRMGLSHEEVAAVRAAAILHDVGKISTPNAVLRKPGRLTDAEFEVIKVHPVQGAQMVSRLQDDELTAMVRHHHERLDGSGYPDGLAGSSIPLGARIIAVADTFDAITSTRPYRPAHTHRAAISVLDNEAGTRLDAAAVRAFESHYRGRRPLATWVALTNLPGRLVSWFGGGASVAAGSVTRMMTASMLTGAFATGVVVIAHHGTTARGGAGSSSYQGFATAAAVPQGSPTTSVAFASGRRSSATRSGRRGAGGSPATQLPGGAVAPSVAKSVALPPTLVAATTASRAGHSGRRLHGLGPTASSPVGSAPSQAGASAGQAQPSAGGAPSHSSGADGTQPSPTGAGPSQPQGSGPAHGVGHAGGPGTGDGVGQKNGHGQGAGQNVTGGQGSGAGQGSGGDGQSSSGAGNAVSQSGQGQGNGGGNGNAGGQGQGNGDAQGSPSGQGQSNAGGQGQGNGDGGGHGNGSGNSAH